MRDLSKGFIEGCYEDEEELVETHWAKFIKWAKGLIKIKTIK